MQAEIERLNACCRHRDEQISTLHGFCNDKDAEIERLRAELDAALDKLREVGDEHS
jgi:uncharacterized small protein (DUF1192 family)